MLMLTTSTSAVSTTQIIPSINACEVQPAVKRQARTETIFAPGAAPLIWPPKRLLPAVMPATCEPCAPATIPMFTQNRSSTGSVSGSTVNGTDSRTAVAGLSWPK